VGGILPVMKNLWKKDGDFYYGDRDALLAAKEAAGIDEAHLRRRMGHGFDIWAKALSGMRLDLYEKNHVECGLTTDAELHEAMRQYRNFAPSGRPS
jgi:hypothetical protein